MVRSTLTLAGYRAIQRRTPWELTTVTSVKAVKFLLRIAKMTNVDSSREGAAALGENVRALLIAILLIVGGIALGVWTDSSSPIVSPATVLRTATTR